MLSLRSISVLATLSMIGCGEPSAPVSSSPPAQTTSGQNSSAVSAPPMVDDVNVSPNETGSATAPVPDPDTEFAPLSTTATSPATATANGSKGAAKVTGEARLQIIMQQLKPLQVMLGNWRGTTRKDYDGFKAVDNHEWIWDLQSDPQQPALAVKSDKSPYLTTARLTWDVEASRFQLTATDSDGTSRQYTGDYSDPVHEIVGPDDKLHRVFRLELTQTDESAKQAGGESWQVAFAQQENNRYLLEVAKRRGTAAYRRYDTVSTQREGTSFALSDSDYGEKECVISQGLGTIAVSHKGKTYWVCCSGCKAAFEEDPETWIARAATRAKE